MTFDAVTAVQRPAPERGPLLFAWGALGLLFARREGSVVRGVADERGTLERSCDEAQRLNERFGGTEPVVSAVLASPGAWLLDVACGGADVPRAILREARRRGRRLDIVATDVDAETLAFAKARAKGEPLMRFVVTDALALPFPDGAFDIVTCTFALHAFAPPDAVDALRELRRVSKGAVIVGDVRRTPLNDGLARAALARLTTDAAVRRSVAAALRRAYALEDACDMARLAGWHRPVARRLPYLRMLMTDDVPNAEPGSGVE